jgi:hypothetical protein
MFSNLVLEETRYEAIGDFEDGGNPVLPIPESERIGITGMGTGGSATAIEMTCEPVKLTPEERWLPIRRLPKVVPGEVFLPPPVLDAEATEGDDNEATPAEASQCSCYRHGNKGFYAESKVQKMLKQMQYPSTFFTPDTDPEPESDVGDGESHPT